MSVSPDTIIIITPKPGTTTALVVQNTPLLTDAEIAASLRELAEKLDPSKKE
jgi:hypothetical protein